MRKALSCAVLFIFEQIHLEISLYFNRVSKPQMAGKLMLLEFKGDLRITTGRINEV